MPIEKYTTASRVATVYDIDKIIFANHASTPIVITIPADKDFLITDNDGTPVIAILRKGDAAASFAAGTNVLLVGTEPTAEKDGKPIAVVRHGVNTSGQVVWGYL